MPLAVEQYKFSGTGVLLNSAASIPFVDVLSVDGLDNAPIRLNSTDREGMHGGFVDAEFEGPRTVTLEGNVYADPDDMETYLDSLKANFAPTKNTKSLIFGTDAGERVVYGKSLGFRYSKDANRNLGIVAFQVQIMCPDSRIYDNTTLTLEVDWVSGTNNSNAFVVGGNRATPAVIEMLGPITNPFFIHSGNRFDFATTIATGDTIKVDLDARTAIRTSNNANVRNTLTITTGDWFYVDAAGTRTFQYGGTGGDANTKMTVTLQNAWW